MDNFHHSDQATNMSASGGLSDRSSLPLADNFHHEHGSAMSAGGLADRSSLPISGGLSDRSPLPLGVDQDQAVQSWSSTAAQEDVAADYSMFPATQSEGDYSSQQMTDIVHQTYMHSGLTQNDGYEGDHLRDMTRQQNLDMFNGRSLNMADTYETRGSLNEQHGVEVYEPRGGISDQHAVDLFQMKDVSQDPINKGKDVPLVGRVMAEARSQPSLKMSDHISESRHFSLSDIQDLRRVGMSGIQTICKPGITDENYTVLDMHYNNRANVEVTSSSNMSDSRYQSLIDSMSLAQRVNLSAGNTSRHLLPALSPQYADERPPRMVNPQYVGNHGGNRQGRPVANLDTYNGKGNVEMFQTDKVDTPVTDRNVAAVSLSQHRTVPRNSMDVFSERSGASFGPCQQMFEDSVRTSSSRTSNTNANFVYAEISAPIVKARHLCFQEEDVVQSKTSGTNVSFSFVDNSVPMSKMSHQMYEDDLRTSQTSTGSEYIGGVLSVNGGSNHSSDIVTGRSDQEVLLTDKEWNQVTRLKLFHMMTNKKMCDVALKAGELRIEIHKVVLCASSDQLAMLLDSVDNDGFPVLSTTIQVSEEVLHAFAEFLYLGSVKVTIENISEMNTLANAFHIYALHDLCWELLEKNGTGANNRLLDLKLTFENRVPCNIQKKDCGINTDSVENFDAEILGFSENQNNQSITKPDMVGRGRGRGRGRVRGQGQGRSKNVVEESKSPKPAVKTSPVDKIPPVMHTYGTRGVAKKRVFEESNFEDSKSKNQKVAVKFYMQVASKRKRVNPNKVTNDEAADDNAAVVEPAAPSESKAGGDGKDVEGKVKAPVKLQHRSLKQKLMQSVSEDSALDALAVMNFNPLCKLMIDEVNDAAADELDDAGDYTNVKGRKGKKARTRKVPVPPNVQMTVRPPPKKRAKMELKLKQEEEELGLGLNLSILEENMDDLPMTFPPEQELPPPPKPAKTVKANKRERQKRNRFAKTDAIGQQALNLESLANHIRFKLRQYKCDLCGNEFVFPKRSVTHLINTHNIDVNDVMSYVTVRERVEESPKVCDICGYKSKDPNFYYVHIHKYFRHGIPLPKGWKPFSCDICGKELFTKFQLKDHRRVHFEETPFICQICGQGFKSRTCLNSHMFHRHSDERKHQCPECSKSFKTKTQRLVHLRTHSGEKPYQCPECCYKSTTRGNMRLHLTNRHKLDQQTAKSIMRDINNLTEDVKTSVDTDIKQGLGQDIMEEHSYDMVRSQETNANVSGATTITLTDKGVLAAAEHAMHAILLPLAQGDNDASTISPQTIATYVVTGSVPLTGEMGEAISIGDQSVQNTSQIGQPDDQCNAINPAQTHLYMQHSPISPPPQSVSPQTYVSSAHNINSLSPINLPANHQGQTLVTDDSIGSGTDAAIIQAYYQQQFYPQHY